MEIFFQKLNNELLTLLPEAGEALLLLLVGSILPWAGLGTIQERTSFTTTTTPGMIVVASTTSIFPEIPELVITEVTPVLEVPLVEPTAVQTTEKAEPVDLHVPVVKDPTKETPIDDKKNETEVKTNESVITEYPNPCDSETFENQFLCLLNEYRATKDMAALRYVPDLTAVATSHSEWMDSTNTLSHIDGEGRSPLDRCAEYGTTCLSEVAASGPRNPEKLLHIWKESSSHNEILLGNYTLAGLGIKGRYFTLLVR